MLKVFIGSGPRWDDHESVLGYSIRKHASVPVNIAFLRSDYLGLADTGCTGFSNLRYAIPELCGYQGSAIYLDIDMLLLADIAELADYAQPGKWVVMADGSDEVAVIDCSIRPPPLEELDQHKKHEIKNKLVKHMNPAIPSEWNVEDTWRPGAKLLHFTNLHFVEDCWRRGVPWYSNHPAESQDVLNRYMLESHGQYGLNQEQSKVH